jgi:hypothetical protein
VRLGGSYCNANAALTGSAKIRLRLLAVGKGACRQECRLTATSSAAKRGARRNELERRRLPTPPQHPVVPVVAPATIGGDAVFVVHIAVAKVGGM